MSCADTNSSGRGQEVAGHDGNGKGLGVRLKVTGGVEITLSGPLESLLGVAQAMSSRLKF